MVPIMWAEHYSSIKVFGQNVWYRHSIVTDEWHVKALAKTSNYLLTQKKNNERTIPTQKKTIFGQTFP
jgi:hypothetical protein